jgi:hypothetical protein
VTHRGVTSPASEGGKGTPAARRSAGLTAGTSHARRTTESAPATLTRAVAAGYLPWRSADLEGADPEARKAWVMERKADAMRRPQLYMGPAGEDGPLPGAWL